MKFYLFLFLSGTLLLMVAPTSFAASDPLSSIYQIRPDLQAIFDEDSGLAVSPKAGFLTSLNDWATQYGWQEYPTELSAYKPSVLPPKQGKTSAPAVTASHYIVIDKSSGQILAAQKAETLWPIASISKLMTAQVAVLSGVSMTKTVAMKTSDNVGGAQLYVNDGTTFSLTDLFYAMLIGSANNAANAIARTVSPTFVDLMNARAETLQLPHTRFVDPSGIETQNVSNAREVAIFADAAFTLDPIKQMVTTSQKDIYAISVAAWHHLKSTNWMLYHSDFDDVYVTGGKTGYLDESGWNVVERLRPSANAKSKELLIVLFGADSRQASFDDAEALADWVWTSFSY